MKKTFLLAIICLLTVSAYSKTYMNKEFALFDINIVISDELMQKFVIKYGPLISNNPNRTVVIKKLKDNFYYYLKDFLVNEKDLIILPITTYGIKIKYDIDGYPDSNLKKAVKHSDTKYYLKIDIELEDLLEEKEWSEKETVKELENQDDYVIPVCKITMSIYDKNGMLPIDKFESIIKVEEAIKLDNSFMQGIINSKTSFEKNQLMHLFAQATNDIASNIKR